jgi:hypothetical protein
VAACSAAQQHHEHCGLSCSTCCRDSCRKPVLCEQQAGRRQN